MPWGRPRWTIAALVGQATIYEHLAQAIVAVRLPGTLSFADRIREAIEPQVAPVECLAVVRYVLAVRVARGGALRTPEAETALQRLQVYEATRIASCVTDQRSRDSSFQAFALSDLAPLH